MASSWPSCGADGGRPGLKGAAAVPARWGSRQTVMPGQVPR